jgi:hypothetical protein
MTLKTCLEIGNDCGLETVGEALYNIDLHAMNIFDYSKIDIELGHLKLQADDLYSKTNFTEDSSVEKVLEWMSIEDDGIDETELNL